jgi:uncharacterized membrane protein YjgN (DUF898 family)
MIPYQLPSTSYNGVHFSFGASQIQWLNSLQDDACDSVGFEGTLLLPAQPLEQVHQVFVLLVSIKNCRHIPHIQASSNI